MHTMRLPSLVLSLLLASPCFAGIDAPEPVHGPVHVIDGDTVRLGNGEIVRLYNIDAPETRRPRCQAEKNAGYRATSYMIAWFSGWPAKISRGEPSTGRYRDRYGRTLATMSVGPIGDVGDTLVALGLALPWQPGRAAHDARARHWCGGGHG